MNTQQVIDIILWAGCVGFGAWGIYSGALRQISFVASFLIAFVIARVFGPEVASALDWSRPLVYMLLFFLAYICVAWIFKILKFTAKMLLLGPIDRIAGMLVGLFKWILAMSLILNLLHLINSHWPIYGSWIACHTLRFVPWLFGHF